ncbi:hypothetical protein BH11ACT8_BH11ACT8_07680 [soil metagenome]
MDTTSCPECAAPAEIEWRAVLEGTDGAVEHARVRCVAKHWFLLPLAALGGVVGPEHERSMRTSAWADNWSR